MAITGVHNLIYSSQPEELRTLLVDVLGLGHVDDGQDAGWLIFKLPPAELGVHPADAPSHEIAELTAKGVVFKGDPIDEGWGVTVRMSLPGEVDMMLYQPRHNTAI